MLAHNNLQFRQEFIKGEHVKFSREKLCDPLPLTVFALNINLEAMLDSEKLSRTLRSIPDGGAVFADFGRSVQCAVFPVDQDALVAAH